MCSCKGKNPSGKGFHKPTVRSFLHSLRCQRFGPDAHFTHRPHPVRALSTETEVAQVKVKSERAAVFLCRILTRPEEEEGGAKVSARLAIVCVFGKNKRSNMSKPNYSGTFHMVEQQNMDTYLAALDINFALRKIVCLLKPSKEITHDPASGAMKIRTVTTFKNFNMDFTIGEEFTEDLGPVDGRLCQTTVSWEGDKLLCVQRGEKEGRGWTHWLEGDKLHLEMRVQDIVAKQVFKKGD